MQIGPPFIPLSDRVAMHLERYQAGEMVCPRMALRMDANNHRVYTEYSDAYLREWDAQCLLLRATMFCRKVA